MEVGIKPAFHFMHPPNGDMKRRWEEAMNTTVGRIHEVRP